MSQTTTHDCDRPRESIELETVEHLSILEYNDRAADYGKEPGERVIANGVRRNTHYRDDDLEDFVKVAEAVAIIELHKPIPEEEVTGWCNSPAGKLALGHWFDHYDPEEIASP